MRLFSTKRKQSTNQRKTGKRVLIVAGVMLALFMAAPITNTNLGGMTAYAAEQSQGYNWSQEGQVWKVKDSVGNYLLNDWYKDGTGTWYYIGADGVMQTGLIDVGGHFYYMGIDGKMVTTDGVYNGVSLVFNKDATSPTYGEVVSGAQEMKNLSSSLGQVQGTQQTQAPAQQTQEKIPYQVVTNEFGDREYWDPVAEVWVTVESYMTKGDETSALWDEEAAELGRQVGENMAH